MKNYNDLAPFRFSLIAPVINQSHVFTTNEEYYRDVSAKNYNFCGKEYTFSASFIKK